jgi:DNA-binding response OmpR family regulator
MSWKILLTDDDELVLLSLEELMDSQGFEVHTASNGAEALAKAGNESFDLVVLDVIMPGMSGFEVCAKLREMEAYQEKPIIMLTAKSSSADKEKGLKAGATNFLPKPIDAGKLLAAIQELLG